jgi:hypothetical protein
MLSKYRPPIYYPGPPGRSAGLSTAPDEYRTPYGMLDMVPPAADATVRTGPLLRLLVSLAGAVAAYGCLVLGAASCQRPGGLGVPVVEATDVEMHCLVVRPDALHHELAVSTGVSQARHISPWPSPPQILARLLCGRRPSASFSRMRGRMPSSSIAAFRACGGDDARFTGVSTLCDR